MAARAAELNMQVTPRLSNQTLGRLATHVWQPRYDCHKLGIGIVHLGAGAFMRAHTAVYCDDAIAAHGGNWGIAAVSLRHRYVCEQLHPQDCLYTVVTRDRGATSYRLIGAIRSIDVAPDDPQKVLRLLASPELRIVTLTVTEKGYCLDADSGVLDLSHPGIAHDLKHPEHPRTAIGYLVEGLRMRHATNAPPVTILSCDNLPGNGARLRAAVVRFAVQIDSALAAWIEACIRFPATMVDRMVPATTESDISEAAGAIGCHDAALVKAEPFSQWVIEDDFANGRPAWEAGGATFVSDVTPYETAKLRLLNGAHSTLAYLGYLAGFEYVHEVMQQRAFVTFIRRMLRDEISPVTPQPEGMPHAEYIESVLQRFANTALRHRTWQIAMDGSQKLPQRLLNTARAQLRSGGPIAGVSLAVAAWMRYALGRDESGRKIDVRDPLAARFATIAAAGDTEAEDIVNRFLLLSDVFGEDLAANVRFAGVVAGYYRELVESGAAATVQRFVETGSS